MEYFHEETFNEEIGKMFHKELKSLVLYGNVARLQVSPRLNKYKYTVRNRENSLNKGLKEYYYISGENYKASFFLSRLVDFLKSGQYWPEKVTFFGISTIKAVNIVS